MNWPGIFTVSASWTTRAIARSGFAISDHKPQTYRNGSAAKNPANEPNLSQAAFARYLNLTPGYISQLERGAKQPKGPALTLLNVIRRKGFEVVL